jgi:hypothetical protein
MAALVPNRLPTPITALDIYAKKVYDAQEVIQMENVLSEESWEMLKRQFAALEKSLKLIQNTFPDLTPALDAAKKTNLSQAIEQAGKQLEQIKRLLEQQGGHSKLG